MNYRDIIIFRRTFFYVLKRLLFESGLLITVFFESDIEAVFHVDNSI